MRPVDASRRNKPQGSAFNLYNFFIEIDFMILLCNDTNSLVTFHTQRLIIEHAFQQFSPQVVSLSLSLCSSIQNVYHISSIAAAYIAAHMTRLCSENINVMNSFH